MPDFLRKDRLAEPVLQITCDHLYQQVQFIALVVDLAVFTESKAAFDLVDRGLYSAPLVVIVEYLCIRQVIDVCDDRLVFVPALIEDQLVESVRCRQCLPDDYDAS